MKTIGKKSWLTLCVVLTVVLYSNSAFSEVEEDQANPGLVGRIAHIEGQLLRFMPDDDDWVLTDQDTPFGQYDNLFSSDDGKAEFIMPNNTLLRIGGDTQVQLIELTNEVTEINVSSGTARLYNKSTSAEIKATTPFGDVIMPPDSACDVSVQETQAEIASLKGSVEFIKTGSTTRQEVIAGSSAIIVNAEQIAASAPSVNEPWDSWNAHRDAQWTQRMQARGESKKYLPENLQDHAYDLDTNGRWERVYYDGAYNYFWRPAYVSAGWAPFSSGRWVLWHGEQTWVPCEPFGYVTHHYGNWVHARNHWYWAPPAYVGMYWYPGRVAWVSSSISIGWFPLAPYEMYYCNRYWGPWSRVRYNHHYYDCRKYRHYRHARYIDHHHFYGSRNYHHAGFHKRHHNEKVKGTVFIPEKIRKDHKDKNKQRYASNIPKFKNKVKNIVVRKDTRTMQVAENKLHANPSKRTVVKGFESSGKPIVEDTSKTVIKDTKQAQQKLESAHTGVPKVKLENKGKRNRSVTTTMETRKEGADTTRRYFQQPPEKMTDNLRINPEQVEKPIERSFKKTEDNRRTLQESVPKTRQNTRPKFYSTEQNRSNSDRNAQNTVSDTRLQSNRSGKASRESFSHTNSSIGTSYSRPTGQQRMQQNSTGGMQYNSSGSTGSSRGMQHNSTGSTGSTGGMQGYSGRGR